MSFKDLKKNRANDFKKLQENVEGLKKNNFEADPNEWYPTVDKSGNGLATIRFLPKINEDDLDFARWWSHEFKDPTTGKWYIENCLFTLDESADPVMEFNKKLWDSVVNSDSAKDHPNRKQATRQARKIHFVSNIFVIDDPLNPENNGKCKKFKYGKWAMDKIEGVLFPKFAGKKSINPFDLWEGVNFNIEIFSEKKDGKFQRNYNNSNFDKEPSQLADDAKLEKIYEEYKDWSIKSYLSPKNFKSYADLKKRLDEVVGYDTGTWNAKSAEKQSFASSEPKQQKSVKQEVIADESEDFFNNLKRDIDDDIPF